MTARFARQGFAVGFVAANPVTVVTVTIVPAVFGVTASPVTLAGAIGLSFSVFLGAISLWLLLTRAVLVLRDRVGDNMRDLLNRGVTLIIPGIGILYLCSAIPWHRLG